MNGSMGVKIGSLLDVSVYGGPYRSKPTDMLGVKMAVEINAPCDIDIPTKDFNVPDVQTFKLGLAKGLGLLVYGDTPLYVGCMGGIGRTGLYLAGLAKVMSEYRRMRRKKTFDPVSYVREHYLSHAVETKEQQQYIKDLDVTDLVQWCAVTQDVLIGPIGFAKDVSKPVPEWADLEPSDYEFKGVVSDEGVTVVIPEETPADPDEDMTLWVNGKSVESPEETPAPLVQDYSEIERRVIAHLLQESEKKEQLTLSPKIGAFRKAVLRFLGLNIS